MSPPPTRPAGAPAVVSAHAQAAFERKSRQMGLEPHHPWIGGYVDYEWEHLRHVAEALPVALPNLRVLEFGCNVGASAIVLAQLGAQVSGIDVCTEIVELARLNARRFGHDDLDLHHVTDSSRLHWPAGAFDLVLCNSVLEYVPVDQLAAVQREIDRVLRPGGLILVTASSNRLWPFEVHSGRWGVNYLPRWLDAWSRKPRVRGVWPWAVRYGFGPHYRNIDDARAGHYFKRSRLRMGAPPLRLNALLTLAGLMRVGPGMLAQSVSCLLQKRA